MIDEVYDAFLEEYQIQKVTLVTDKGNSVMVDTLNRGGGRLVLRNATPSLEKAQEAAKKLGDRKSTRLNSSHL